MIEVQNAWELLIPKEQRPKVLLACHEKPVVGHFGRRKTYERVATYYYWPTIYHDVANYVKKKRNLSTMHSASASARRTLIVFRDTLTKWVELVRIRVTKGKNLTREI